MGFFSKLRPDRNAEHLSSAHGDALQVSRSAHSEFWPTRLSKKLSAEHGQSTGTKEPDAALLLAATIGTATAKSFSSSVRPAFVRQMQREREQRENEGQQDRLTQPRAQGTEQTAGKSQDTQGVSYTDIAQFTQRVELYRGSISTVYKAVSTASQVAVIIKAYSRAKMKPKHVTRLWREVRLMRHLAGACAGVVQIQGTFEDAGHVYIVMEWCAGGDLFKTMMMQGGTLDEHWVCAQVVAPLLRVLVRLHADHIVHRDIKPENLFLTRQRRLKLGDFGLAINADEELPFTRSGTLTTWPPRCVLANPSTETQESPEVKKDELRNRGIRPYDEKVDVWAVGVLAFELIVGKPPFEVKQEAETAHMIMTSNHIPFPAKHSPLWAHFVQVALEKKPHARPTAAALLEHPWLLFHTRKHARETAQAPPLEDMFAAPARLAPTKSMSAVELPAMPTTTGTVGLKQAATMKDASRPPFISVHAHASLMHPAVAALQSPRTPSASGSSFTALITAVPPLADSMAYPHSTDLPPPGADGTDAASLAGQSGIRTRMQHYFNRQKGL